MAGPDALGVLVDTVNGMSDGGSVLIVVLRDLFATTGFASVVARMPDHALDPLAIADTMIAAENQPMFDNNSRVPTDSERHDLAAMTVESWKRLRAQAVG